MKRLIIIKIKAKYKEKLENQHPMISHLNIAYEVFCKNIATLPTMTVYGGD